MGDAFAPVIGFAVILIMLIIDLGKVESRLMEDRIDKLLEDLKTKGEKMPRYVDLEDPMVYIGGYTPDGHTVYHVPSNTPRADIRKNIHAHWISASHDRFFKSQIYKCSSCGNILDFYGVNAGRGDANFCPNCGAQMDER